MFLLLDIGCTVRLKFHNEGAWVYPDGGGYSSTMTRVK